MKTKLLASIAVGVLVTNANLRADWEDYFWITSPNINNGFVLLPNPSAYLLDGVPTVALPTPGTKPAWAGAWTVGHVGPGVGQFQVSPANPDSYGNPPYAAGSLPATAFTLFNPGGVGGSTSFLYIPPPTATDVYNPVGYTFDWVLNFKAGTTAWYVDSDGVPKPIVGTPSQPNSGSDLIFKTDISSPTLPALMGFWISGDLSNSLQVQGWEPVPEPSTIAMGLVTLFGAGLLVYRRRVSK